MTPAAIITEAAADGVHLALSAAGTLKAAGEQAAVNRWLPLLRERKPLIVAALQQARSAEHEPVDAATHAETPRRSATGAEAAEVRALVAAIYPDDTEADRGDALAATPADPDDDRRTCTECANLRGGTCTAASPGGIVVASVGYRPSALFREAPHRCEGFAMKSTPQPGGLPAQTERTTP